MKEIEEKPTVIQWSLIDGQNIWLTITTFLLVLYAVKFVATDKSTLFIFASLIEMIKIVGVWPLLFFIVLLNIILVLFFIAFLFNYEIWKQNKKIIIVF